MFASASSRAASLRRRWGAGLVAAVSTVVLLPALAAQPAVAEPDTRAASTASTTSVSAADIELARRYAPRVRLDREEEYFPSDVESFLSNTHIETHPDGDKPSQQFRVTNQPLGCDSCTNPVFLNGMADGGDPEEAPAYAEVVHRTDNGRATNITDINYWMFYPYNRGKRVCMTVYTELGCVGGLYSTFGHHVGDWEHVTIRFVDNVPTQVTMSQHDGGQTLPYDAGGLARVGDQPVVYSARGSHGLYPNAAAHTYRNLPNGDSLVDHTSNGPLWDTRQALKVFPWQPAGSYTGEWSWLNFSGRWGNPKSGCTLVETFSGECILNPGPDGPNRKAVFDPHMQAMENAPALLGGPAAQVVADGARIGVVTTDGVAYVRDALGVRPWSRVADNVKSMVLSGVRVGVLSRTGVAYVKEDLDKEWVHLAEGVRSLSMSGSRIGVLMNEGGIAYVKDGGISAEWLRVSDGVDSLALSGNRVGVVKKDGGVAYVKEGTLYEDWVRVNDGVSSLVLSGNRIGVLKKDGGVAYVKEGGLWADWVREYDGVSSLVLSGNRIGVVTTNGGIALVKEGGLSAEWVREYDGVGSLILSGVRIGILNGDTARLKEGNLYAPWGVLNYSYR